jgi:hypothetical protein
MKAKLDELSYDTLAKVPSFRKQADNFKRLRRNRKAYTTLDYAQKAYKALAPLVEVFPSVSLLSKHLELDITDHYFWQATLHASMFGSNMDAPPPEKVMRNYLGDRKQLEKAIDIVTDPKNLQMLAFGEGKSFVNKLTGVTTTMPPALRITMRASMYEDYKLNAKSLGEKPIGRSLFHHLSTYAANGKSSMSNAVDVVTVNYLLIIEHIHSSPCAAGPYFLKNELCALWRSK